MKKEDLISLGLNEEQAGKVWEALDGNFVPKTRFNEVNEENKGLKAQISDRDKQLEGLKKTSGDNAELMKQIEQLQNDNKAQNEAHSAEIAKIRLDNAIDTALTAAGAKNNKAVRAMLAMDGVKLDADGKLSGLSEQLDAVKKSDSYLFNSMANSFKGTKPGAGADGLPTSDTSKMTYSQMVKYLDANPGAEI